MKMSFLLFFALIGGTAHAQGVKPDKIVRLSGDTLRVTVINVGEQSVSFTYQGESATNTLNKNQVKEIDFASGRVQTMSEHIVIASEKDWAKVLITTSESDVAGLVRKGEVRAKATGMTSISNQANIDARATEKIKRAAARMGAHIIFIQSQNTQRGIYGLTTPGSLKQGVAYAYK